MSTTGRGAAAGAVGVVAMDACTGWLYRRERRADLLREKQLRPYGKDTAHALVRRVTGALGSDVGAAEPNGAGIAVHYALGMAPGALYARERGRRPWLRAARGALFGAGLYVVNDLAASRLLGIAGPQHEYPRQAHLRGLVGHVGLGVVTDAMLDAMSSESSGGGCLRQAPSPSGRCDAPSPAVLTAPRRRLVRCQSASSDPGWG